MTNSYELEKASIYKDVPCSAHDVLGQDGVFHQALHYEVGGHFIAMKWRGVNLRGPPCSAHDVLGQDGIFHQALHDDDTL